MSFKLGQKIIDIIRCKKYTPRIIPPTYINESYSQDGEDIVLAAFFDKELTEKSQGVYVDIGAHHPKRFSNTQYFYEKGWRGINIDATPGSMVEFNLQRTEDINLEIGIAPNHSKMKYYMFEEPALNTFDEKTANEYLDYSPLIRTEIIDTFPLTEVLDKYLTIDKQIDFLSIDVEGLDFEIIKTLDFAKYQPKFLLVEDIELIDKEISLLENSPVNVYLKQQNYFAIAKTRRTIIYKKGLEKY